MATAADGQIHDLNARWKRNHGADIANSGFPGRKA
jgi:hypothetical protein